MPVCDKLPGMGKRKSSKPKTGRARDTGEAVPLNVEIPPSFDEILNQFKETHGHSRKWTVVRALEEYFGRMGIKASHSNDPKDKPSE